MHFSTSTISLQGPAGVSKRKETFNRMLRGSIDDSAAPLDPDAHNPFVNLKQQASTRPPNVNPFRFVTRTSMISSDVPRIEVQDLSSDYGVLTPIDERFVDWSQTEQMETPPRKREPILENKNWNEDGNWLPDSHSPSFSGLISGLSLINIDSRNCVLDTELLELSPISPILRNSASQENGLEMNQLMYLHSTLPENVNTVDTLCNSDEMCALDPTTMQSLDLMSQLSIPSLGFPTPPHELPVYWANNIPQEFSSSMAIESSLNYGNALSHHLLSPPEDVLMMTGMPSPFSLTKTFFPIDDGTISPHQMNSNPVHPVMLSDVNMSPPTLICDSIQHVESFGSPLSCCPSQDSGMISSSQVSVVSDLEEPYYLPPTPKISKKSIRPVKKTVREVEPVKKKRTIHPAIYKCTFEGCPKTFTRLYNLKSHFKIHTGEKLHTCPVCNVNFIRNHDLRRHSRLHTNERPFHCDRCGKSFARSDALKRHINVDACVPRYSDDDSFTME